MKARVKQFIDSIEELNHYERTQVSTALESLNGIDLTCEIIETTKDKAPLCPHCGAVRIYRHGQQSGLQRYRCRECERTFNALTGTPLAHLQKKELWLDHMQCLLDSQVFRDVSAKLQINLSTAFRWRHRFTTLLQADQSAFMSGIVEADETYFRESQKGSKHLDRQARHRGKATKRGLSSEQVCVLTVQDRAGNGLECSVGTGPLKIKSLEEILTGHLANDALLISDGARAYKSFCKNHDIDRVVVKPSKGGRVIGSYHIQHINAFHSRLKGWINGRFRGVASQYLDHYLWWRHELDRLKNHETERLLAASLGVFN